MEAQVNNQVDEVTSTADLIEQLEAAREAGDEQRVKELEELLDAESKAEDASESTTDSPETADLEDDLPF